ncbi:hypothetical protein Hanom_Chr05g00396191 [Helianthus anomalus]
MGLLSGNTIADPFCRLVKMEKRCLVTDRGEGGKEREGFVYGGVHVISTNHTFFLNSLPIHEMSNHCQYY